MIESHGASCLLRNGIVVDLVLKRHQEKCVLIFLTFDISCGPGLFNTRLTPRVALSIRPKLRVCPNLYPPIRWLDCTVCRKTPHCCFILSSPNVHRRPCHRIRTEECYKISEIGYRVFSYTNLWNRLIGMEPVDHAVSSMICR